jgi:serine/threonine protein kinase
MDHPNIIKPLHYSETDKFYCVYMEYAGYGSNYLSRRVLGKNRPVKDEKMAIWAQDVLMGISYMHKRGVIHNDIKIDNILIFQQENVQPVA